MRSTWSNALLIVAVVFAAAPSSAQEPAANAKRGERVFVRLTDSKRELQGRLIDLGRDTVSIEVNERRMDLPLTRVLRVDQKQHDSLLNGAIFGLLYVAACAKWWCRQGLSTSAKASAGDMLGAAAVGAGVGALWDASIEKRVTIFNGPAPPAFASPSARLFLTLRF